MYCLVCWLVGRLVFSLDQVIHILVDNQPGRGLHSLSAHFIQFVIL